MSPTLKVHFLVATLCNAVGVGGVDVVPTIEPGKIKLYFHFKNYKLSAECRI